ncbi:MAG: hypothetical protein IIC32_06000 [Chloroflexi bacterium]|nr:hypothetical protein [Chloroflexota bacterium]
MEPLNFDKTPEGFHITDYPDAAKVIRLTGARARRLSHYGGHLYDLGFVTDCLSAINEQEGFIVREALWHSAVIHFVKCFQSSAGRRYKLRFKAVYKGDSGAKEPFEYFQSLRNKNIVHDENGYSQCLPGAVLNGPDAELKVPKVIFMTVVASTLGQDDWSNLHMLATRARDWISGSVDELSDAITEELNQLTYEELDGRPALEYSKPGPDDLGVTKAQP